MYEKLNIEAAQAGIFGRQPTVGQQSRRDVVQAILYAVYLAEPDALIERIKSQFKASNELLQFKVDGKLESWKTTPEDYSPNFSYVLALQEYTQAKTKQYQSTATLWIECDHTIQPTTLL